MKKVLVIMFVMALIIGISSVMAGDEPWYDMKNCEMCKAITSEPNLMENMSMEQHNISNGVMIMETVNKDYMGAFNSCNTKMAAVQDKIMKGEPVTLCNSCKALVAMLGKGVKSEDVTIDHGKVTLLTSDDPAMIKALQDWSAKNKEAMAAMMAPKAEEAPKADENE